MTMKIAVGADHRGHAVKEKIVVLLSERNHEVIDVGANSSTSCDYPDVAFPAARAVADGKVDFAVLICGSGIGMSICANKVAGVRAALCHDELTAQMSRKHNNANVLCLASDVLGDELIRRIVCSWIDTEFDSGGRHERRVRKINCIEDQEDPNSYVSDGNGLQDA
jgi:ribose 5-phosphate isomerase B